VHHWASSCPAWQGIVVVAPFRRGVSQKPRIFPLGRSETPPFYLFLTESEIPRLASLARNDAYRSADIVLFAAQELDRAGGHVVAGPVLVVVPRPDARVLAAVDRLPSTNRAWPLPPSLIFASMSEGQPPRASRAPSPQLSTPRSPVSRPWRTGPSGLFRSQMVALWGTYGSTIAEKGTAWAFL
jgi:hypothetical protein